jgi:hypothetical protein
MYREGCFKNFNKNYINLLSLVLPSTLRLDKGTETGLMGKRQNADPRSVDYTFVDLVHGPLLWTTRVDKYKLCLFSLRHDMSISFGRADILKACIVTKLKSPITCRLYNCLIWMSVDEYMLYERLYSMVNFVKCYMLL